MSEHFAYIYFLLSAYFVVVVFISFNLSIYNFHARIQIFFGEWIQGIMRIIFFAMGMAGGGGSDFYFLVIILCDLKRLEISRGGGFNLHKPFLIRT